MAEWNKQTILEWFQGVGREKVIIRQQGTTVRVEGTLHGVDEVDACSTQIEEVELDVGDPAINVGLSFHKHALAIHLLHLPKGAKTAPVSLAASIPYGQISVTTEAAELEKKRAEQEKAAAVKFSPYELLH